MHRKTHGKMQSKKTGDAWNDAGRSLKDRTSEFHKTDDRYNSSDMKRSTIDVAFTSENPVN